jgi:hypothetical protein
MALEVILPSECKSDYSSAAIANSPPETKRSNGAAQVKLSISPSLALCRGATRHPSTLWVVGQEYTTIPNNSSSAIKTVRRPIDLIGGRFYV